MESDRGSIGELAYHLWQARGCPDGSAEQDWLEAERQLATGSRSQTTAAVDDSLKDTFPASDPTATQGPDEPPANAEAKWRAAGITRKESTSSRGTTKPQPDRTTDLSE